MTYQFRTLVAVLATACAPAAFAETWDLANEYPATSITGRVAERFAELVAEKSGGELEIKVHHGGALGYRSVDHFDAVGEGALQVALSPFTFWTGIDPIFQLCLLPFYAPTNGDSRRLLDIARPEYQTVLADANQIMVTGAPFPTSGLWANKSFTSAEDLKGVKIRTFDAASTETLRALGALPLQISWADVPAQLSTNAIDSVLTSANGGIGAQMWELQSHFTEVKYGASLFAIHINRDAFDALDPEVQEVVIEAGKEAEDYGWKLTDDMEASDRQIMRDHGMTVTEEISAEFAAQLKAAGEPFIENWLQQVGDRAQPLLDQYNAQ